MRPLRLRVRGFGSFREDTTVDFEGVDYFALVGPTGNGKSTVLDAIGFALYGKVPRHDDKSVTRNVVSLGALEARVQLDFDVGADHYTVARNVTLRSKGAPKHEVRLERVHDDGTVESLAAQVREADAAVVELLGLPFDDFTRCVVLPQGEFARFLTDEPRDRRSLLVRLLNLDVYRRLGDAARHHAQRIATDVTALEARLASLADATAEAIVAGVARVVSLESLARATAEASEADAVLAAELADAERRSAEAESLVARLERVSVPVELVEADARLQAATTKLESAVHALELRRVELATATEQRARLGDVAALERRLALHEEIEAAAGKITSATAEVDGATRAYEAARRDADTATTARDAARASYEALRDEHRAHALRSELHDGDRCPVCEQAVAHVPRRAAPPAIEAAVDAAKAAEQRLTVVAERAEAARRAADGATSRLEQQHARHAELIALLAAGGVSSRADDDAALEAARRGEATLATAREAEQRAARAEVAARRDHSAIRQSLEQLADRFDAQRDPVAPLGAPRRGDDLATSWAALVTWAGERRAEQAKAASECRAIASDVTARRGALVEALRARVAAHDVTVGAGTDLAAVATLVSQTVGQAVERLERLRQDRAQAAELATRLETAQQARRVAELLAKLLRDDAFVDWLVGAALASIVARASDTLYELSDRQYSLRATEGSDFEIIDHANADAARSVRTLSGGETFQASLALALAMSDEIASLAANGAPQLEAIFLDEGFGSLDLDSIDTVATTIESLGTSGRMVGVVTHVRELAERIPVRFEVTKSGNCSHVTMVAT